MSTTDNQEASVELEDNAGEGEFEEDEVIQVKKSDFEKLNQTLGSLKRENKDLKKSKDPETPKPNQTDDSKLLEKLERLSLKQAGIDHSEDIDLARATAKKWNVDIDEVLSDEDFKVKLERQQTARANAQATSNIRGSSSASGSVKNTSEYWIAKGVPPTPDQVPDRKTRAEIVRAMINKAGSNGKTFYND